MARWIMLKHRESGIIKRGYYGFSWTTFLFGGFPALFRGDFTSFIGFFVITIVLALLTYGIAGWFTGIFWAFFYNKYYTRRLLERGYQFADLPVVVEHACARLGVRPPALRDITT